MSIHYAAGKTLGARGWELANAFNMHFSSYNCDKADRLEFREGWKEGYLAWSEED